MGHKFAIVEDDAEAAKLLESFLQRFAKENQLSFECRAFPDGDKFLFEQEAYDAIFLDIDMPKINGMEIAKTIRSKGYDVPIVFVTNLAQYALLGYEVHAFDFIVKPMTYERFCLNMSRLMTAIDRRKQRHLFLVKTPEGKKAIFSDDISVIESSGHKILISTDEDTYPFYSSLSAVEEKLKPYGFARCSSYALVNLHKVDAVVGNTLKINGKEIALTRSYRKVFYQQYLQYLDQVI